MPLRKAKSAGYNRSTVSLSYMNFINASHVRVHVQPFCELISDHLRDKGLQPKVFHGTRASTIMLSGQGETQVDRLVETIEPLRNDLEGFFARNRQCGVHLGPILARQMPDAASESMEISLRLEIDPISGNPVLETGEAYDVHGLKTRDVPPRL